jgi:FGGY-family pentulose kinase
MKQRYYLGIDGGTESVRAGVFDAAGKPLAFAAEAYQTTFEHPGWAEQNPDEWWRALCVAVPKALAASGVAPSQIAGIGVDTTSCTVVALDAKLRPLRPAIIWMDVRASEQAAEILASGHRALRVNGAGHGPLSAEWFLPKVKWVKETQPRLYEQAAVFCEYQDYLNYRLTGRMVASINNVSMRWHYDSEDGGFRDDFLQAVALDDLRPKLPAEVVPLGGLVGGLAPEAAEAFGLPAGTPVAQGGADAFIAMIGLGVVRPGSLAFVTGSSHLHLGLTDRRFHADGLWGTYADAVIPGLTVLEGGQTSTGSIINWLRRMLPEDVADYKNLNQKAAALPPGSEGLMVLEHFQGNRTPHTDANSRGVMMGLTLRHGPEHIFRAVMEGIAFGTELIFKTMRNAGFEPQHVVIAGGATRSDLFMQIHADVSGIPIHLTEVGDAPALGSAILAAVGAGDFPDIPTAADAMVRPSRSIEPTAANHERYRELFTIYERLYPQLTDLMHEQVALQAAHSAQPSVTPSRRSIGS